MSGEEVVEFGSGIGAFTLACARIIGASGKIYAVDIQKNLLERLRNEAKTFGVTNVEYIWGDIEELGGVKIKENSVDVVIIVNTLFQLIDKTNTIMEAKRLLRSGGRIIIVDWTDSFGGLGPKPTEIFSAKLAEELLISSGFKKIKEFSAGNYHYGLIFQKIT